MNVSRERDKTIKSSLVLREVIDPAIITLLSLATIFCSGDDFTVSTGMIHYCTDYHYHLDSCYVHSTQRIK